MSHTVKNQPLFTHRIEGERITGVNGIDNLVSLEKIETLLAVLSDYSATLIPEGSRHHYDVLLDLAKDEVLDIKDRVSFQQRQKTGSLN